MDNVLGTTELLCLIGESLDNNSRCSLMRASRVHFQRLAPLHWRRLSDFRKYLRLAGLEAAVVTRMKDNVSVQYELIDLAVLAEVRTDPAVKQRMDLYGDFVREFLPFEMPHARPRRNARERASNDALRPLEYAGYERIQGASLFPNLQRLTIDRFGRPMSCVDLGALITVFACPTLTSICLLGHYKPSHLSTPEHSQSDEHSAAPVFLSHALRPLLGEQSKLQELRYCDTGRPTDACMADLERVLASVPSLRSLVLGPLHVRSGVLARIGRLEKLNHLQIGFPVGISVPFKRDQSAPIRVPPGSFSGVQNLGICGRKREHDEVLELLELEPLLRQCRSLSLTEPETDATRLFLAIVNNAPLLEDLEFIASDSRRTSTRSLHLGNGEAEVLMQRPLRRLTVRNCSLYGLDVFSSPICSRQWRSSLKDLDIESQPVGFEGLMVLAGALPNLQRLTVDVVFHENPEVSDMLPIGDHPLSSQALVLRSGYQMCQLTSLGTHLAARLLLRIWWHVTPELNPVIYMDDSPLRKHSMKMFRLLCCQLDKGRRNQKPAEMTAPVLSSVQNDLSIAGV